MKKFNYDLVVLGGKDGEMLVIQQLLNSAGVKSTIPLIGWGAKPDIELIKKEVPNPFGSSTEHRLVCAQAEYAVDKVLFVECGEHLACESFQLRNLRIVDHHGEHAHKPPSIIQVLTMLEAHGLVVSDTTRRWYELVGANDAGYIPALEALGGTDEEIARVRMFDRVAQGVNRHQEAVADSLLGEAEYAKAARGELLVINSPHSKCSPFTDRLYGHWKDGERLLIVSPGEVNFYGDGGVAESAKAQFGGWGGGSGFGKKGGNAFYGVSGDIEAATKYLIANA